MLVHGNDYLKHLVLSYESLYLVGTFPNVTYVGISDEIHSEPYAETGRSEDVEQLHVLMKALKNRDRFPNLRTVQLRDVSRDEFRDTVWNSSESWTLSAGWIGLRPLQNMRLKWQRQMVTSSYLYRIFQITSFWTGTI